MQIPIIWGEPETSYIRRFMDGVNKVVTDEMQSGRSLPEESFTFVLARLLCWFNRPRLNRNIWLFLLLVLVQNLLYVSKCLVQSARLNQHMLCFTQPYRSSLCVLRALCGELYISTFQSGSYLA